MIRNSRLIPPLVIVLITPLLLGSGWRTRSEYYAINCIISKTPGTPTGCLSGQNAEKDWRTQASNAKNYWNSVGNFTIRWAHEENQNSCSCSGASSNPPNIITTEGGYPPELTFYAFARLTSEQIGSDEYIVDADIIFDGDNLYLLGDGSE